MIASQTRILQVHKFTAGLDATWSVDAEFNIDLPSGDGRRADGKRTRDDREPVRRPDAVVVVDANGAVHNDARDEQANAHVKQKAEDEEGRTSPQ